MRRYRLRLPPRLLPERVSSIRRVLFVCVENAARSLMAEAIFNAHAPEGWVAESAGTRPTACPNPRTGGCLTEIGLSLPARLHVSVGFGYSSRAESKYILGQCWARRASADGVNHIFLGPQEGDPAAMLVSLLHELIHAADDCQSGHKGAFAEAATRLGFEGPMTRTPPGLDLTAEVITLAEALGPFPHARLDPTTADVPVPDPPGAAPAPGPGGKVHSGPGKQGTPHDQADRRMLRLHRPHHPQMARRGLPAVPARPAHARGLTRPPPARTCLNAPSLPGPGAFKRPQGPGLAGADAGTAVYPGAPVGDLPDPAQDPG